MGERDHKVYTLLEIWKIKFSNNGFIIIMCIWHSADKEVGNYNDEVTRSNC